MADDSQPDLPAPALQPPYAGLAEIPLLLRLAAGGFPVRDGNRFVVDDKIGREP